MCIPVNDLFISPSKQDKISLWKLSCSILSLMYLYIYINHIYVFFYIINNNLINIFKLYTLYICIYICIYELLLNLYFYLYISIYVPYVLLSLVSEARLLNMEELRYSVAATSYCASPFDSTESPKNTKYRRLCM